MQNSALAVPSSAVPSSRRKLRLSSLIGFGLVHLAAFGVIFVGFSWKGVLLCAASYFLRMFAITAGFHRYFSHKTYRLNRFWQFMMAFLGQTAAQKGVLWWASHHRHHHKYSDQPEDLHSPVQNGFWWSHMGWILAPDYAPTDLTRIPDLAKFPELVWLNRNQYVPTLLYAIALSLVWGPVGLFYGYFLSTALLWHGTFSINSIMHVFGRRVFQTSDDSRNSFIFALVTMGEGWHNNHHYYPGSAAQGFHWWQLDASYYILWVGQKLGIVQNLRPAPSPERMNADQLLLAGRTRLDDAVTAAGESLHHRLELLSRRWEEAKSSARLAADQAVLDLETRRARAAERLSQLQADYAAAVTRAGNTAERHREELFAEMERVRLHLVEILERLLEACGIAAVPDVATA